MNIVAIINAGDSKYKFKGVLWFFKLISDKEGFVWQWMTTGTSLPESYKNKPFLFYRIHKDVDRFNPVRATFLDSDLDDLISDNIDDYIDGLVKI